MYRLYYVSTACPDLGEDDIKSLVDAAAAKNQRLGITGALAYDGERFAQILEGAKAEVSALMNAIRADGRHSGVVVMDEKPVQRRIYEGWALKHMDSLIFENFESVMAEA